MTVEDLIQALALPDSTRVNQRVPKKLLLEHGAATATDKRLIQDGVDAILWLAALKPHLIGVPAYEDGERQYLELAVLQLTLKPGVKPGRLIELLHRAVPYPMLLLTTSDAGTIVSLAHLRRSQTEADKTVLDGELVSATFSTEAAHSAVLSDYCASIALAQQPKVNICELYQGWIDALTAWQVASLTGRFERVSPQQTVARRLAFNRCRELDAQISSLHAVARREKQAARQVAINREIKALVAERQQVEKTL